MLYMSTWLFSTYSYYVDFNTTVSIRVCCNIGWRKG